MTDARTSPKAAKSFQPGRTVLELSKTPHSEWIARATERGHLKVITVSSDPQEALKQEREKVALLIDDLGSLHFSERPLELLGQYYAALAHDGQAWLRFPKSFWVFLEDQHRISLSDYLSTKFPTVAKRLSPGELDPLFMKAASGPENWILLKKDRSVKTLSFSLSEQTLGGISRPENAAHTPYLEFKEIHPNGKKSARRVA